MSEKEKQLLFKVMQSYKQYKYTYKVDDFNRMMYVYNNKQEEVIGVNLAYSLPDTLTAIVLDIADDRARNGFR